MSNFQNIEETKEFALAKTVEMAINNYSFNAKAFAKSIPFMHPTNQQSLYRLIRECLKVMADNSRHYDERNMASHLEAVSLIDSLYGIESSIPMI